MSEPEPDWAADSPSIAAVFEAAGLSAHTLR